MILNIKKLALEYIQGRVITRVTTFIAQQCLFSSIKPKPNNVANPVFLTNVQKHSSGGIFFHRSLSTSTVCRLSENLQVVYLFRHYYSSLCFGMNSIILPLLMSIYFYYLC